MTYLSSFIGCYQARYSIFNQLSTYPFVRVLAPVPEEFTQLIMSNRGRVFIALLTAFFAATFIRSRGKSHHETPSSKVLPDAIETPYQAPFFNPNAPLEDDVSPDSYLIYLTPGYSLDEHKAHHGHPEHVGGLLDRGRKGYKDNIVYVGTNFNDELLAKIRADPKVVMVEYDHLITGESLESPTHLAPLEKCDGPIKERVEGSYQVLLGPDYSFKEHSRVVGTDVEKLLQEKYNFHTNKWVYSIKPVDRALLRAIREDRGVELVVCEQRAKRQTEGDLRPK